MPTLVSDLITQAFLDLASIAPGEPITASELSDAFMRLNQMLSTWSTEDLAVFNKVHQAFTPTAGTDLYTLGSTGSLATTGGLIPVRITGAASVSGTFRKGMRVVSFEAFDAEVQDDIGSTSVLAEVLAADNAYPAINVRIHPVPGPFPGTLWLDYWTAVLQFTGVGQTVSLPLGWEAALHWSLAEELFPQYARPGNQIDVISANASKAKGAIAALCAQILGRDTTAAPAAQKAA